MKIFNNPKKGSALLVVLGFLTFMIISAVSFSIYMRIERQASSNYRHSITARHLLESALYRAMDEVDADLRGNSPAGTAVKFPTHATWEGRVFTSKSNTPEIEDARVLSLEALSFLPASLVNDARYYSKSTPQEPTYGTKWRRMSMPIEGLVDIQNNRARSSGNKSFVGRYAYICVNLSDMLNINGCSAAPGRSLSNLVSVANLFGTPGDSTMANRFSLQASNDVHYATMQDFYACMAVANKNFFGGASDSPYIHFLKNGKNLSFNDTYNHLLVTDGFAKAPPPAVSPSCNAMLNQPFPLLSGGPQSGNPGTVMSPYVDLTFSATLTSLFPDELSRPGNPFWAAFFDYLAPDEKVPYRLDAPSSKLAPMICQVRLADPIMPVIKAQVINAGQPTERTEYSLHVVQNPDVVRTPGLGLQARVCYPFKDVSPRNSEKFVLTVKGFIRVDKQGSEPNMTTKIRALDSDIRFIASADVVPPTIESGGSAQTLQQKCYKWIPIPIDIPNAVGVIKLAEKKSDGSVIAMPGFDANKPINLSVVIISMTLHQQLILDFDKVPAYPPGPEDATDPKLYFQTGSVSIAPAIGPLPDGSQGRSVPYLWDSLEVPDPRFNHYLVNWFSNGKQPDNSIADPDYLGNGMHKMTKDLLGEDGRDADIFMASSGQKNLQSVGELGFIIRPYKSDFAKGKKHVDFRVQKFLTKASMDPAKDESEGFFRTIRLYDHKLPGDPPTLQRQRDKIFENFYMALDKDGNLPLNSNVRINPLTGIGPIIECALDRIPYNYYQAKAGSLPKQNFTEGSLKDGWAAFSSVWAKTFTNEVRASGLNTSFEKNLSDFYGEATRMGWYSPEKDARQTIFKDGFVASAPVFEIDRKMLYSFSLDSMSDRQQLFLYVFQAESVAPISFAEMRSLSGGRAVALVWRDPYPKGSRPDNPVGLAGSWYENSSSGGSKGYYEHKILFFKQLDN
jgi:hypothetical protein